MSEEETAIGTGKISLKHFREDPAKDYYYIHIPKKISSNKAFQKTFPADTPVVISFDGEALSIQPLRVYVEAERPLLQHLNTYEDNVKIIDRELNRIATVYFKGGRTHCDICDRSECIHLDFALTVPDVRKALEKSGYRVRRPRL